MGFYTYCSTEIFAPMADPKPPARVLTGHSGVSQPAIPPSKIK
jgi:hypothetical protein